MAKMNLDELRKFRASKKEEWKKRETEIQVIIGVGTCGIAAGAKKTLDAFVSGLKEHQLEDNVKIRQTGCMGLCHSEPMVELIVPGMPSVLYGNVNEEIAKVIIQEHIIGRKLLNGRILDYPAVDILKA